MHFTVSTHDFAAALTAVIGAVPQKPFLPMLENFLLEQKEDQLSITGTDTETCIKTNIDVTGTATGQIAIPAKRLFDIIKALPNQPVTIIVEETDAIIQTGRATYKIPVEKPDDFPVMTPVKEAIHATIPSQAIDEAANGVIFAASTDMLRPVMCGLYCKLSPQGITMVATDAHKLVRYEHTGNAYENTTEFILPAKVVALLKKAVPVESDVWVAVNNSGNAQFTFGRTQISCTLISGRYPDYRVVIPEKNVIIATINRADLLQSVKRAALFTNKATSAVSFTFAAKAGTVVVQGEDFDYNTSAKETIACELEGLLSAEPLTIGFNAKFLVELISALSSEQVLIKMNTPHNAILIAPDVQEQNQDYLMLLMPLMIHNK